VLVSTEVLYNIDYDCNALCDSDLYAFYLLRNYWKIEQLYTNIDFMLL